MQARCLAREVYESLLHVHSAAVTAAAASAARQRDERSHRMHLRTTRYGAAVTAHLSGSRFRAGPTGRRQPRASSLRGVALGHDRHERKRLPTPALATAPRIRSGVRRADAHVRTDVRKRQRQRQRDSRSEARRRSLWKFPPEMCGSFQCGASARARRLVQRRPHWRWPWRSRPRGAACPYSEYSPERRKASADASPARIARVRCCAVRRHACAAAGLAGRWAPAGAAA